MATYKKVSKSIPSKERATIITDVAEGDLINLSEIMGRPARKITFNMTSSSDVIEYRINNRVEKFATQKPEESYAGFGTELVYGIHNKTKHEFWNKNATLHTGTGDTILESMDGLNISSLEIVSLSLSTGSVITIDVI